MAKRDLTAERLRESLSYDSETGVFTRRLATSGRFGWPGRVCGSPDKKGHIYICVDGARYAAHRLAWLYVHGVWPLDQIDHINRVKDDNRIANLREATAAVNTQNLAEPRASNTTGFLGVSRLHKRFRAMIGANGVRHQLGIYDTPEEAYAVYLEAKRRLHPGCTI